MICRWMQILFVAVALVVVGAALNQTASGASIYKWVDEKGVTHYSENPPPQSKSKPLELRTAPSTSDEKTGATAGKTLQQQDLEFQERRSQRETAAVKEERERQAARMAEAEKKRRCAEAKARVAYLQQQRHGPAATWNEKGEIEWWNFERRGIEINELGRYIDQNCPPD